MHERDGCYRAASAGRYFAVGVQPLRLRSHCSSVFRRSCGTLEAARLNADGGGMTPTAEISAALAARIAAVTLVHAVGRRAARIDAAGIAIARLDADQRFAGLLAGLTLISFILAISRRVGRFDLLNAVRQARRAVGNLVILDRAPVPR